MDEYNRNLVINFLQEVIDKSVITDARLSVGELESYDMTQYEESDLIILKNYFLEIEEYIYVAYIQKKLNEL